MILIRTKKYEHRVHRTQTKQDNQIKVLPRATTPKIHNTYNLMFTAKKQKNKMTSYQQKTTSNCAIRRGWPAPPNQQSMRTTVETFQASSSNILIQRPHSTITSTCEMKVLWLTASVSTQQTLSSVLGSCMRQAAGYEKKQDGNANALLWAFDHGQTWMANAKTAMTQKAYPTTPNNKKHDHK